MNKQQKWQRIGTLASLMVVFAMLLSFVNTDAAANWSPDLKKGKPNKGLSPMEFFGYNIGDDYQLTPWTTREMDGVGLRKGVVEYFYHLEKYTNRVRIFPIGTSEDGSPQIIAVFATPPTWARIDYYKEINRKLADPRLIGSDAEALALAKAGKPVYWLNAGIHASERTGIETEVQMAFELAAGKDDRVNEILDNLIVIIEGTNNPDGEKLVTDWYYKYLGTPYTNSSPPCYHKYICHDTNRDFVGLSVQELANSALARFEWNPVAYQDMHQTRDLHYLGMPADPVNYNYGSLSSAEMLGLNGFVITEMIADGYKGVFTYDYADMWNPMYNHMYTVMHNGIGGWWELTGVSMASPRTINAGLNNGHRTWFNPEPYFAPFEYHLIDAVNMQKDSHMYGLLYAARHRVEFLYNFYMTAKMKMAQATSTAPYAFVVPANGGDNHDVIDLINTLVWAQHIEVFKATADFSVDGQMFLAGDYIVPLNQPYGLYAKLLLTRQDFPIQEVVNPYLCRGDACATYDHQAWTMGLLGDVAVVGLNTPLPALAWEPVVGIQPYAGVLMGGVSSDYVLEHGSNNGLAVVLPLLWQNANYGVSQVDAAFVAAGMNFPAGTFLVHTTGSQSDHDYFKALVEQEGLKSYAIGAGEAPGGAVPLAQPKIGMLKPNSSTMPEG